MFLTTRNPDVLGLTNRVNRLLSDTLGSFDWQLRDSATAAWVPPVDILEEADAIRIMAEVPGIDPRAVKISVEGNVLTIHGTKQQDRDVAEGGAGEAAADRGAGGFEVTAGRLTPGRRPGVSRAQHPS